MERDNLKVIRITNSDNELLSRAYEDVLSQLFKNEDDLDSLEEIKSHLKKFGGTDYSLPGYNVLVLLQNDKVVGITIFGLFGHEDFCFVKGEYTGILKEARKNGSFDFLLSERMKIILEELSKIGLNEVDFVLNELESPDKVNGTKHTIERTLRLWRMKGFKKINFEFVQLPLNKDKSSISYFDLYMQPLSDKLKSLSELSSNQMKLILNACQTFRISNDKPENYIEYQNMLEQINREGQIKICRN